MTEGAGIHAGDLPDDLTAAEAGMWQAFRNGTVYDLRAGNATVDDPHGGHPWGPSAPYGPASCAGCSWTGRRPWRGGWRP